MSSAYRQAFEHLRKEYLSKVDHKVDTRWANHSRLLNRMGADSTMEYCLGLDSGEKNWPDVEHTKK